MVDCRGDSVHTCYSGSRPWSTAIAEENGWTDRLWQPIILFFLRFERYLALAVFSVLHTWHQHAATDEMGVRMGRPHFYTMLVHEWETTSAWTGQTWQDYKAELLRVRGLNVMSTAEYQMVSQMGVFPFLRWTFIDVYPCMSDYEPYELWLWYLYARLLVITIVFVCTLIIIVFVCMIINCCFGVVFYINMSIAHAKISIYFTPGNHFWPDDFFALLSGNWSNRPG